MAKPINQGELEGLPPMDRSKWKRVRFGDVVRCVDKTCRDPEAEGLTRVVGLEHLDPGELKISRWADVADGTSFTRTFRAGQVLFGKRRAYQRKAALADFDGICSGDILVFEAKDGQIIPALLPFIVQSDAFFNRAIGSSAGSLSPRTKWSELALFEFDLPDASEQAWIADVLVAAETARKRFAEVGARLDELWLSQVQQAFVTDSAKPIPLVSVGKWLSGGTPSRSNREFWGGDVPWVSPKDMKQTRIGSSEETLTEVGAEHLRKVPAETILLVTRGMILAHTLPICLTERELTFNQDVKALSVAEQHCPRFVHAALLANEAQLLALVDEAGHGTKRIPTDALHAFKLSLPDLDEQIRSADVLGELEQRKNDCALHVSHIKELKRQLLDTWFGSADV